MVPNSFTKAWNVMKKDEVIRCIIANKKPLKIYGVKRIGLFGSVARGNAREGSDIDFLVEFEKGKKNFENYIDLALFLRKLLGDNIDIVTPESLSPYIAPYILKEVEFVEIH
jgi:hypothetical protein